MTSPNTRSIMRDAGHCANSPGVTNSCMRGTDVAKRICSVEGCERLVYAKAICESHYKKLRKWGPTMEPPPPSFPQCEVIDCDDDGRQKGLCPRHYKAAWKVKRKADPRPFAQCVVENCDRPQHAYQMCTMHSRRWKKFGTAALPTISPQDRFWLKVDKSGPVPDYRPELGPCWLWKPPPTFHGYGQFNLDGRGGVPKRAHILSYEWSVGAVPDGLELDHLCRVRNCVRPEHLEPVTSAENSRRGAEARKALAERNA